MPLTAPVTEAEPDSLANAENDATALLVGNGVIVTVTVGDKTFVTLDDM